MKTMTYPCRLLTLKLNNGMCNVNVFMLLPSWRTTKSLAVFNCSIERVRQYAKCVPNSCWNSSSATPASIEATGSCYTFRCSSPQTHRAPKIQLSSKNSGKLTKVQEDFLAALERPPGKNSTSDNYHNFTLLLLGKDQAATRMAARKNRTDRPKMRGKGKVTIAKFVLTKRRG